MTNENLKLKSILKNKEAEAESRGNKINWEDTDFSGSDDSTTTTDTREMLTKALRDGDMDMAKFYQDKLRKDTHAFGRQ